MARIRCKSCGKAYNYQGDCCPHCGAFNRKPQQGYIGADGDYHAVDEKVCFEEKVCYEDQADKAWRDSPDRKPERRSRVKRPNTTRFTSGEANQVIDRFTRSANESAKKFAGQFLRDDDDAGDSFARNFREKTAQFSSKRRGADYASRRERSSGKGGVLVMGLSILIALAGLAVNILDEVGFSSHREPAYPEDVATAPAIPDNLHYYDYGGIFRLNDGREFTAFTTQMTVDGSGTVNVSVYCDGMGEGVWPVLVDEWTMTEYEPNMSTEWQENNYDLTFYTETHDPNEYWYTLYYRDTSTGERYHIAEINSTGYMSADPNASQNGVFRDIPLLDGETLYTTVLMENNVDGSLTVDVICGYENLHGRFLPYLQDESSGDLYEPIESVDSGTGAYQYFFDVGIANFDRTFTFVYYDADYDTMLNVASYVVAVDGTADPTHQWGEEYEFYLRDGGVLHANVLMHYDQRRHEVVAYATHDGDPDRFHPHLSLDGAENISLYLPSDIESDDGLEYRYAFDARSLEAGPSGGQYTFCYLDSNTGDIFYTETLFVSPVPGAEPEEVDFTLSDGTAVDATAHYTYTDQVLTVFAAHNGDMDRLRAFAYDTDTGVYHDAALIEDDGAGNYTYTFELSACDASATISFGFEDMERSRNYFLMDCFA